MDNLLILGFGNTLADSVAYEMAGISQWDIYMIDKKSQISCMNHDVDGTILEHIKVNSQGSLVLSEDSNTMDDSPRSEQ
jgi:phosphatidate phosphatase PAH1